MPPQDLELKEMFQVRDALKLLCDYGYELTDMLGMINEEIEVEVKRLEEVHA